MRRKRVELTTKERAKLERFCPAGACGVRPVNRAKIILGLDRLEAGRRRNRRPWRSASGRAAMP